MRQESTATVREWAARLSHPSVELLVLDDHVVVQEDGELIASGRLLAPDHDRPSEHTE
jgi:hypothetical protein